MEIGFRFVGICVILILCKEQAEVLRNLLIAEHGALVDQSLKTSPQPSTTATGGVASSSEEETAPLPQPPNNPIVDILASTDEEPEASIDEGQQGPEEATASDAQAEAEHAEESSNSGESRSVAEDSSAAAALGSPAVRSSPSPPQGFPTVTVVVTAPDGDVACSGPSASHPTADAAAGGDQSSAPSENCPNFDSSGDTVHKLKTDICSGLPGTLQVQNPGTAPGPQNPPKAATVAVDTPQDGPQVNTIPTVSRAISTTDAVEPTPRSGLNDSSNIFPTSTLMSDRPPAPASEGGSSDHGSEPPAVTSLCFSDLGPSIVKWYTGLPAQFLSRYNALSKRPSNHPVSLDDLSRNLSLGLVNSTYFCSRRVKNYDGILVLDAGRKTVPVGGGFFGCWGRGGGSAVPPRKDPIIIWCDMCFQNLLNLPPKFAFI